MNKKTVIMMGAAGMACFMLGAAATSAIQTVTAQIRPDFKVVVNETPQILIDKSGNALAPLVYNGTTYLPVRAVSEILGIDVDWDGNTKTIFLTQEQIEQVTTPETVQYGVLSDTALQNLSAQITALEASITGLLYSEKESENFARYTQYHARIEALELACDQLEDSCERQYKSGAITREQNWQYKQQIDDLDEKLDKVEELLEARLHYDL